MPVIGTAGHVDHGKSSLVLALTGTDPDRWAEEKERGLTIDLGFAHTQIDDIDVSFVDVPGHERFIANMLAGVVGVDCALLVIAADSGWMPQTEEHVRVLEAVGAARGVIALTRTDLVDEDTAEFAKLEISEELADSPLATWPIVPVSAKTHVGIDDLRTTLTEALRTVEPSSEVGFRMWVDRAFQIHGSGLVVTGTVLRGVLQRDDELEVVPGAARARVRGIQRHDDAVELVRAGERAAINITGVDIGEIGRGSMLSTPMTSMASHRVVLEWHPGRGFATPPERGAFHLHTGTADRPVRLRPLAQDLYLATADRPFPATIGDRVVIREAGRQTVVGGATIIDPTPPHRIQRDQLAAYAEPSLSAVDRLMKAHRSIDREELLRASGGREPDASLAVGGAYVEASAVGDLVDRIRDTVRGYHAEHPLRDGIPIAELTTRIAMDRPVVDHAIDSADDLRLIEGVAASIDHRPVLDADQERRWAESVELLEASFGVPRASSLPADSELLHAMLRRGDAIQVADDVVFTSRQIDQLVDGLRDFPEPFTVSEFGERFEMARRQSVPLLEWMDKQGFTRRTGDARTVRDLAD